MNLLADEGIDRQIVNRLRQQGHSVLYIAEMKPDEELLNAFTVITPGTIRIRRPNR